jgi:hypothetical protein
VDVWVQYVIGPVVVLAAGVLVRQMRQVRRENSEQHAAGQEKIDLLIDSHHNLTGKVDGLVDRVDRHMGDGHEHAKGRKKTK